MTSNPKRDLSQRFVADRLSRRRFAAGALALGASAGAVGAALAQPDPIKQLDAESGTYPLTEEKVTFRVLCPTNPRVEDFATNRFTQWYEEKTNVHLEWEIVPAAEAQTSLNVRLAGGDLPDIIIGFEQSPSPIQPSLQMLYGSQGVFLRLNDLIEQHGVETKRVFAQMPLAREVCTAPDGSIYALPTIAGCYHCSLQNKLWIYRPWLEQLGLAMPTTTDEFEQVLLAFKERDPNGTGQVDELPLVGATASVHPLDHFFMNAFTFNPGGDRLVVPDGVIEAVYATEPWRQGIAYLARLYAQGLIAPESFTQDRDQLRQISNRPDYPVLGSVPAIAPSAFIDLDPEGVGRWAGYDAVPPLAGPDGTRYAFLNPYQPFRPGAFVITSACRQPDIAFRWADGLYDLETSMRAVEGFPGEHWRWAEPGEIGNNGEPAVWERLYNYGDIQNFTWNQTGPYFRTEAIHSGQVADPERAGRSLETMLYRETRGKYLPYAQPAELVLPPLFFTQEQAQEVAELEATIAAYVEETFALAVSGQLDIAAEWENYLATLEGMGLAQYLQIHQDAYDARPTA